MIYLEVQNIMDISSKQPLMSSKFYCYYKQIMKNRLP